MHVSRRTIMQLSFALIATISAQTAVSAPVTTNAPIVVTASRANRTAEEMPANVTVITEQNLHDSGAKDVVSALETLGGVYFRRNSDNPGQAEVSMRGFGQNSSGRVLVLVDGQRLNTSDMANLDWLRIPVDSVERIEVLHGGQTALYGDYAVAGVINIITHQPSDQPSTTISATVGSDNTYAGHIGHSGSVGDTRYIADLDWRTSDGWRDNSQYDNTDARVTLSHDWNEGFATDLSSFYTYNSYGMPGYLTLAEMRQDPRQTDMPLDNATTKTFGGNLVGKGQIDADSRIEANLSASHREIISDFYSYFVPSFSDSLLDSYAFSPRYIDDSDWAGHRNNLLVGVDLGLEKYSKQDYTDPARTVPQDGGSLDRARAGIYAQDEFWLSQQVSMSLGARGDLCRYASDVITNIGTGAASSSSKIDRESALDAALLYHPTDNVKLYARASTLFRDPFVDEMATLNPSFAPTNGTLMNTNLKPEIGEQLEVGATFTIDKEWSADLSAYRLDMKDEIAWFSLPGSSRGYNSNLDQTRRYGADATLTWQRHDVGLVSLSYNYVDAFFTAGDNKDKELPLVPANVLTAHGELELPCDLAALVTAHGVSAQYLGDDYIHESPRLPTYATLDLGLRYRPHDLDGFELLIGVDNVFDKIYANSGYDWGGPPFGPFDVYYPAAGRTWKITATYRF